MNTSVVYPAKSAPAIGYLKSSANDIEIFVEDTSNPNMWVKLLKKYLPDHIRLNSVTPLGGRANVINACKADQSVDGRKKLYIIDGDLDLIQGKRKPNLKHLYRLRGYCIENYLLDEQSILEIATIFDGKVDMAAARKKLQFSSWLEDNLKLWKPLFVAYATSNHLLEQKIETVGFSVTRLTKLHPQNSYLCPHKTGFRIFSVYRRTRATIDSNELRGCSERFSATINKLRAEDVISGKDYIMPLLYSRMKTLFKLSVKKDVFVAMLSDKVGHKHDVYLQRRLKKICA